MNSTQKQMIKPIVRAIKAGRVAFIRGTEQLYSASWDPSWKKEHNAIATFGVKKDGSLTIDSPMGVLKFGKGTMQHLARLLKEDAF